MSKPLPIEYIHRVHAAAKRTMGSVIRRRAWPDSPWSSPVVVMQLCEEIARLNIELEQTTALKTADRKHGEQT